MQRLRIPRVTALVRVDCGGWSAAERRGLYDLRLLLHANIEELFENYLHERVEVCHFLV